LGIELETNRAAFAVEACRVFTEKASKNNIQFCHFEAQEGNCSDDANCKQALMSASLVWINNEIFQPGDNVKLFKYLHSVVPVNCIIMSFVELLVTKRSSKTTPQSDEPTDFLVYPTRHPSLHAVLTELGSSLGTAPTECPTRTKTGFERW
jgi:hypothetical protein